MTGMLVAALTVDTPARSLAQVGGIAGQGGMAPAAGLVNNGIARFKEIEANGPGWMYWGVNAADRGLGYRGSYMTVGGFVPYAEDDLGGFWSADLRSHLSNYGGFFSNVGMVRKQFLGGTILGLGVYWDYDGDQNQYSDTTITDSRGTYVFAGGQSYNQVGVSGEWLTDYGNLRSNGYIPVGTTAQQMGPFVGNSWLCQTGINAALAGADLEVGAYIPGLADWAGMVSVGGYAFGNARYDTVNGTDLVPYFGGVYTRLDLTLVRNWDFSLQANNDSFFDWTGFARLTYRMGGSRRRNVPDQMEQPMMRNEHIVRSHQAPEQAINPATGRPYEVLHVDNTATTLPAGVGTKENPFTTLEQARNAATKDYDIVFVHQGRSATTPYTTPIEGYTFLANNQYLVGEGTSLQLETATCGLKPLWAAKTSQGYPVITNPAGPAVVLTGIDLATGNTATTGATVDHVRITGSPIGITDSITVAGTDYSPSLATVKDVQIFGNGPGQRGVLIQDLGGNGGTSNFSAMDLRNLTADGFVVSTGAGGNPFVNLANSTIQNTIGSGVVVENLSDPTPGAGRVSVVNTTITNSTQAGVFVANGNALVDGSTFRENSLAGVYIQDADPADPSAAGVSTVQVANSRFFGQSIGIWANAVSGTSNITLTNNDIVTTSSPLGANGIILAAGTTTDTGTPGVLNASVTGNRIRPLIVTTSTTGTTTATVGNILLQTTGSLATTGTFTPYGTLNIKALSLGQLQSLNANSGVTTVPPPNGTIVPPPPNYDGALNVPAPTP